MKYALLILLVLAIGCSERVITTTPIPKPSFDGLSEETQVAVRQSKRMVLLTLEPWHGTFHEHRILSTKEVTDLAELSKVVAAFDMTVTEDQNWFKANCFDPRHAIQIEIDGESCDLLICFSCGLGERNFSGKRSWFGISQTGREKMNDVFEELGVTLSPGSRKPN